MAEKQRVRTHMVLLYPDNEQHRKALEVVHKNYNYAMILHDKDEWTIDDEKENPEHKAGTIKKAHWHVIIKFAEGVWTSALAKNLGIDEKFVEPIRKFDNALLYLVHYNDTDKTQYDPKEVKGPLGKRVREIINKLEKSEGEKVTELIEWLESDNTVVTVTDFAKYCALNGYWSEFRRSGAIFCKIIEEHNKRVVEKYNEDIE